MWYACDEPPPGQGNCGKAGATGSAVWTVLCQNSTSDHGASTPIIPVLVTTRISWTDAQNGTAGCSPNAENSIDWMIPSIDTFTQMSDYTSYLATTCCGGSPNRLVGSYLACGSAGTCSNGIVGNLTFPNYDIDAVPVANRAMQWMTFLHGQTLELYYGVDTQFCNGCHPWASQYTFGNNGDGTLVYPCSASQCGAKTPIWLPSLRLKMIRDGMQDYEYLLALTNAGQTSFVQQQINSWITNSSTFNVDPAALTAARQALGNKIHQLGYPMALQPPSNLADTVQ